MALEWISTLMRHIEPMAKTTTARTRYSPEIKEAVRTRYPLCRSYADKDALARELGIGSVAKLYNLASRLKVTQHPGSEGRESDALRSVVDRAFAPERLLVREDPSECVFTSDDDDYLHRHFGRQHLAVMALHCNHTESAMTWRARKLGLRQPVRWWDLERVTAWLGMSGPALSRAGVHLYRCCDQRGRVRIVLVDAVELVNMLLDGGMWQSLVARGADQFFIRELIDAQLQVNRGQAEWEPTWVSHSHTCLNPFSSLSFGLFYDGSDDKLLGADFTPADLDPRRVGHLS